MKNLVMIFYGCRLVPAQEEEMAQGILVHFNSDSSKGFSKRFPESLIERRGIRIFKAEATNHSNQGLVDIDCSFNLFSENKSFLKDLVAKTFNVDQDYFYFRFPHEDRIPADEIRYKKIGG